MNVKKTKTLVFEHRKSATPAFLYGTDVIEQVNELKYLGMMMHGTKGLTPALELLHSSKKGHAWTSTSMPTVADA